MKKNYDVRHKLKANCYYQDPDGKFYSISIDKLKKMKNEHRGLFDIIRQNLYLTASTDVRMVAVINGNNTGFRRKGNPGGNHKGSSRKNEDSIHKRYKKAFEKIKAPTLSDKENKRVKIYIKEVMVEKNVKEFGEPFRPDIRYILEKTEPEEYFEKWGGELSLEITNTSGVKAEKSEYHYIEGKALFEYKIGSPMPYPMKELVDRFENYTISGVWINMCENRIKLEWKANPKSGNLVTTYNGITYTIVKSKMNQDHYGVISDKFRVYSYFGKPFDSVEKVKKYVEFRILFEKEKDDINKK